MTPEQRLEANFVHYLRQVLGDDVVVASGSDFEVARGDFWCTVDLQDDVQALGGPNFQARAMFALSAHMSVGSARFNEKYSALRDAILQDPQPVYDTLHVPQACFDAMNHCPGVADARPQSGSHLWDLAEPSYSSGLATGANNSQIMEAVVIGLCTFAAVDWDGATKYAGTRA